MTKTDKELTYVPLRKCTSQHEEDLARETRSRASDPLSILARAYADEDPERPDHEQSSSLYALTRLFELRRNCFVMTGHCHLTSWKRLDLRVIEVYTKKVSDTSGLRRPNFEELLEADKTLFTRIFELVNDRSWTLDEALHEFAVNRQDIDHLLQPRVRTFAAHPQQQPWPHDQRGSANRKVAKDHVKDQSQKWGKQQKGKGGKGGKDKGSKGKGKGGKDKGGKDSSGAEICRRFNQGTCTNTECKYKHVCSKVLSSGYTCGKQHPAINCTR